MRQAPDTQRHEHDLLEALLEASPALVVLVDTECRLEYANARFEALSGWRLDEARGESWLETFVPSRDRDVARARFEQILNGETVRDSAVALVTRSGEERLVEWHRHVLRDERRAATAVLAVGLDVTERRQLEDERRRQAQLLSEVGDAVVLTDLAGRVIDWNTGAEQLYGFSAAEMLGKPIRDIYAPADWDSFDADLIAPLIARGKHRAEARAVNKSGRELVVSLRLAVIRNSDGAPVGMVGYSTDVTEQRRAEQALAESELLHRTLTELSPVGIYRCTPARTTTYVNDRWCEILGLAPEEATGSDWAGSVHPDDLQRVIAEWSEATEEQPFVSEFRVVRPTGQTVWVLSQARPEKTPGGTLIGYVGSILDTTDRRAAQEALRQNEKRLQEAIRVSSIGIFDHDQVEDTVYWSPEQRAIYGIGPDVPIDMALYLDHLHPDDRDAMAEAVRRAHDPSGDGRFDVEHRIVRAGGEVRWLTTRSQTLFEGEGASRRPVRTVGAVLDVTERKRAEARLAEAAARLETAQRMEAIGTLAAGIAHDFNNILGSILGNAELALLDTSSVSEMREELRAVQQSARRGADVVEQILTFSREGREPRRVVALLPIVEEAVHLARASLPSGITLTLEVDGDVPNVVANETQIHQVVINLCTNARHAIGDSGGRVDVRLTGVALERDRPEIDPELPAGAYAHVSVSDTGSGIDPAFLNRIFEPFFTTKEIGRGTGLGLAVAHGVVRSHGGAITVASELGKGTRFDLYFPATETSLPPEGHEDVSRQDGRGERILFVDDEPALTSLGERALSLAGYAVSGFTDPRAALAAFRADPAAFDLVIADVSMPGMSGIELARELCGLRPDLPVVLASGYVTDELKAASEQLGVREVLHKPTSLADLTRTADELVRRG